MAIELLVITGPFLLQAVVDEALPINDHELLNTLAIAFLVLGAFQLLFSLSRTWVGEAAYLSYQQYNAEVSKLTAYADELWGRGKPSSEGASAIPISSEKDLKENGYICYAAKPNSLLVRADGRVGKCTVAFNDERNTIGTINRDGTLTIDNSKLHTWMRGFETMDADFLACPLSRLHKYENRKIDLEIRS